VGMIFFITSLRHTTVAHVAVIYATIPFVAAALGEPQMVTYTVRGHAWDRLDPAVPKFEKMPPM
jgi:drug/metabolite transporter (DMT)-like permease